MAYQLPHPSLENSGSEAFDTICHAASLHEVATVSSCPFGVMFAVFMEWPCPWHLILSEYELYLMRRYMKVCACPALLDLVGDSMLRGTEVWVLHCHCSSPGSLQCLAAAQLLRRWFYLFVMGSLINMRIPWYRPWVNAGLPKEILYVASVFVRGRHLVYINVRYDEHARHLLQTVSFGHAAFNYGNMNNMLVLLCTYCRPGDEIRFRCCARRTRRLLTRSVVELDSISSRPLRASRCERYRQRMFDSVMFRGRALKYEVFNTCRDRR